MEPKGVYKAIAAVQADLATDGISKNRRNQAQGYQFRGIDDVYNALAPILAKHGLCILPRMIDRSVVERESQKGGALFYVTVTAEFDLVFAGDGSMHTIRTYGEAMDSGDKATNKAMSAAYKYAAMQAFAIPTEGDNDADATTHDVKASVTLEQPKTVVKGRIDEPRGNGKGFASKYNGTCAICGARYSVGDPITKHANGYGHAVCPDVAEMSEH